MKKFLLLFGLLLSVTTGWTKPIPASQARQVAENLGLLQQGQKHEVLLADEAVSSEGSLYYLFNITNGDGFVIVAGDDASLPVLAYSHQQDYSKSNVSPSFLKWMEWYKLQIREIRDQNLKADSTITAQWKLYLNPPASSPIVINASAGPLLSTTWNQAPYYNALCPYDNGEGERTVTGCVATAMAQILKYHNYPAQGTGSHSYNHETYGTLAANFGATTYNWNSMPNKLTSSNNAVATLMYHCGVSVDMNYGVGSQGGSGAYVISDRSPVTHCSEYAFKTYFDYDANLSGESRSDYTQTNWINKLKAEIDNDRPVLYAGFGQGGHAFVCDGYDNNNYFHFNWGWGGLYDGYFSVNSLNPGTGGAGAGAGTYNNNQQAIFGVKPAGGNGGGGGGGGSHNIFLYSSITINPNPVDYLQSFSVSVDIANGGTSAFNGSFGAAVYSSDNQFVAWVETVNNVSLSNGYYSSRTFSTNGLNSLVPGSYQMGVYYKETGGQWVAIGNGNYSNFVTFNVVGAQGNIRLYAPITTNPQVIQKGKPFSVEFNIANYSTSMAFNGIVSVDLHKSDGTWIKELTRSSSLNLPANSYFTTPITLNVADIDEEPGTYKLQVWYQRTGGDWDWVSTGNFVNPVNIQVIIPGLNPDPFENNNSEVSARILPVNFSANKALVKTTGSNIHNGTDLDYYDLVLPSGYDYTITARAHDSYNSGDGNTYTCDVNVSYKNGPGWSESFDDVVPGTLTVENGGTLRYLLSPYFTGQTGTYLLEVNITRVKRNDPNGLVETSVSLFNSYPNPVQPGDQLLIDGPVEKIERIEMLNIRGQLILSREMTASDRISLPVDMPSGIYFIRLHGALPTETLKIVVR